MHLKNSTTKIKSLIFSRRILASDTREKIDGVVVASARFSDAVVEQVDKWICQLLNIRCTRLRAEKNHAERNGNCIRLRRTI